MYLMSYLLDILLAANQRVMFDFSKRSIAELGFPDGCCTDADDNLWVACFSASKVIQIDTKTGNYRNQRTVLQTPQMSVYIVRVSL